MPAKFPGHPRSHGRQSFEGEHEVFDHHPFPWKTPTPPGGFRTQKVNLCALFSCLKSETSHQNRAAPPKSRCRTFLRTPLSHFPLIRSRQGAKGVCRGGLVEDIAALGFPKWIALQGGVAATVTPIALLCATKLRVCNRWLFAI